MITEINAPGIAKIGNMMQCQIALERAIQRSNNLPGLVCFYGPSGWGKSLSSNYLCNQMRGYYVQVKSIWSKKVFLQKILNEMGIKPGATCGEMLDQVCDQLSSSARPLIIDEMDHLVDKKAVELVRDIYEGSQAPILIIGEENLPQKLKNGSASTAASWRLCQLWRSISTTPNAWPAYMPPVLIVPTTCLNAWLLIATALCAVCALIWTLCAKPPPNRPLKRWIWPGAKPMAWRFTPVKHLSGGSRNG